MSTDYKGQTDLAKLEGYWVQAFQNMTDRRRREAEESEARRRVEGGREGGSKAI